MDIKPERDLLGRPGFGTGQRPSWRNRKKAVVVVGMFEPFPNYCCLLLRVCISEDDDNALEWALG